MKTMKFAFLTFLLALTPVIFASPNAGNGLEKIAQGDWELLGTRTVNMGADHDEIMVTAKDGVFTKVKLKIKKAPIFLKNINIIFRNGENKNVVFNKNFPAGSETRVIDLPGNKRIINKVKLNYTTKNKSKNGRAIVALWGKK